MEIISSRKNESVRFMRELFRDKSLRGERDLSLSRASIYAANRARRGMILSCLRIRNARRQNTRKPLRLCGILLGIPL